MRTGHAGIRGRFQGNGPCRAKYPLAYGHGRVEHRRHRPQGNRRFLNRRNESGCRVQEDGPG